MRKFKICLIFIGSCLKTNTAFTPLNSHFTLKDFLFGGVKVTKNADPDKYVYTGYGSGFNLRS